MPLTRKAPKCPTCKKRMVRGGETVTGYPVFHCGYCLTVLARGPVKLALKTPETPVWRGDPEKNPHKRRDRGPL